MLKFVHIPLKSQFTAAIQEKHKEDIVFIEDTHEIVAKGVSYIIPSLTTVSDGTVSASATEKARTLTVKAADAPANNNVTHAEVDPDTGILTIYVKTYNDTLKQIDHGTDGEYVTTTVSTKANNKQSISASVKVADLSANAEAEDAQGLVDAQAMKQYIQDMMTWEELNPADYT